MNDTNDTNEQRAPLALPGAFIIVGRDMPGPSWILADDATRAFFWRRHEKHGMERTARVFHPLASFALPAHSEAFLIDIALHYEGPHETATRGMAAALALGHPIGNGRDLTEGFGSDGGRPAVLVPDAPLPIAPAGAAPLAGDGIDSATRASLDALDALDAAESLSRDAQRAADAARDALESAQAAQERARAELSAAVTKAPTAPRSARTTARAMPAPAASGSAWDAL